ncbi:MAG: hydrogenase [Rhodanobacteraceae bacterium]|nr:MAG: hydrogenase [Rhodanobacteraceae bacterium]
MNFLIDKVRRTRHDGSDDLLSAGLGLAGLAGSPVPFADPTAPTPAELRRRAIQMGWNGIVDLGPLGGFGTVYGGVPFVPGREFSAFAKLPHAMQPHRVLCQVPDDFDATARCLVVAPSSGSRGVYGPIGLAGAWGLPKGCAVVYTDKGTGSGYFDCRDGTGAALDGTRAEAGSAVLELEPRGYSAGDGIAVKHAHSRDNPEADWGADVLQAVEFGLGMLGEAFPNLAPFTPENTRIIAIGTSNGGGAVLQAAGVDAGGWLDGVVALEPQVHTPGHGRALYDYATEAALWLPAALAAPRFATVPFARAGGNVPPASIARLELLAARNLLPDGSADTQASAALAHLREGGWTDAALDSAALSTAFDMWRAIGATYASAYLRTGVGAMPGGFSFRASEVAGLSRAAVRATWWPDGTGIPPHPGVALSGGTDGSSDPTSPGILLLRALWEGDRRAAGVRATIAALNAALPRTALPIWIVHGDGDGLVPAAFTSVPYVDWLRSHGRRPRYWRVPHAQHFDAFLQLPGFGDRYVPLLPYGYAALDAVYAHVVSGAPLPDSPAPDARPRGANPLRPDHLGLGF